ncbi:hypothetical protein SprV_0401696100 [Sparganum proliferum]
MTALSAVGHQRPPDEPPLASPGGKFATIVSVYAPLITKPEVARIKFYKDLHGIPASMPKADKLIALGDFNARVGTEQAAWRGALGPHGLSGCNDNVRVLLLSVVADSDEGASVENRWCQLMDTFQSTAQAVLGRARRHHQDWLDDIDVGTSDLLVERNCLHKAYVDRHTDENRAVYYHSCRLFQRRLRETQDAWTTRKARKVQGYEDRNE